MDLKIIRVKSISNLEVSGFFWMRDTICLVKISMICAYIWKDDSISYLSCTREMDMTTKEDIALEAEIPEE
jgi:hypothetical protein